MISAPGFCFANDLFRGLDLPKLPKKHKSYVGLSKKSQYTEYLYEILHRSVLLGSTLVLDFIKAPKEVQQAARQLSDAESIPIRSGIMKKEGVKWKSHKSRYIYCILQI